MKTCLPIILFFAAGCMTESQLTTTPASEALIGSQDITRQAVDRTPLETDSGMHTICTTTLGTNVVCGTY